MNISIPADKVTEIRQIIEKLLLKKTVTRKKLESIIVSVRSSRNNKQCESLFSCYGERRITNIEMIPSSIETKPIALS
jgi:hypothetical protein